MIAALVGGNDLKTHIIDWHGPTIAKIEKAAVEFWDSIERNAPPPPFEAQDYDVVRRVYATATDNEADLTGDNELPILCAELSVLAEQRKASEKQEKALKAKIFGKVGDHARAICNGFLIRAPEIVKQMPAKDAHEQRYRQLTVKELHA